MSFKDRLQRAVPVWKQIAKRTTPFVRQELIAGDSAGAVACAGIKKGDQLVAVIESATSTSVLTSRTAEYIANTDPGQLILVDGFIDSTGGTDTTGDTLLVTWIAWAE